jgi:hypothetical protein
VVVLAVVQSFMTGFTFTCRTTKSPGPIQALSAPLLSLKILIKATDDHENYKLGIVRLQCSALRGSEPGTAARGSFLGLAELRP